MWDRSFTDPPTLQLLLYTGIIIEKTQIAIIAKKKNENQLPDIEMH